MKPPKSSLASILVFLGTANATPPSTFEFGGIATGELGGHVAYSLYPGESTFLQLRLEEGLLNLHPRGISIHTAAIGLGHEEEMTSHTFLRISAGNGFSQIYNAGPTPPDFTERLGFFRAAPEVLWFPYGRFSGPSLGLNLGVNFQYRYSYTDKPLPDNLSKISTQIFAGLVL